MTNAIYGRSMNLSQMKPHELLFLLSGLLAVALGAILFGLAYTPRWTNSQLTAAVFTLALDAAMGVALWLCWILAGKNAMNSGIVALIASVLLLAFGGQAGLVAGIVGLLAGALAIASPYLPSASKH